MDFTIKRYYGDDIEDMSAENNKFKSYEQTVEETLSRYSVQDLHEQTDADLYVGDERFYKATTELNVIETGEANLIKFWKIQSGENVYEVRRFKNFVYCSCRGFHFSRKACKHISLSARVYCMNCFQLSAKVGKLCRGCDMNKNHFLKQSSSAVRTA